MRINEVLQKQIPNRYQTSVWTRQNECNLITSASGIISCLSSLTQHTLPLHQTKMVCGILTVKRVEQNSQHPHELPTKRKAHPAGMLQAGSDALKPNVHTIFVFVHKCMDNRCGFYAKSTIRKYAHIPGISQYFLYPLPSTVKDGGVVCALRCMIVLAFNCSINNMNCRILRAIWICKDTRQPILVDRIWLDEGQTCHVWQINRITLLHLWFLMLNRASGASVI